MLRITLFLIINLSIMFMIWLVLCLVGFQSHSISRLLTLSALFGFGGSLISLFLSKNSTIKKLNKKSVRTRSLVLENWISNIIQKQSKTVGIKAPKFIIYRSDSVNAFTTGSRKNSSVIGISSSLLSNLGPDEIKAVIAHEISHIKNGDMVTMALLQGTLNTFVLFTARIVSKLISGIFSDSLKYKSSKNSSTISNKKKSNKDEEDSITFFIFSSILEIIFGTLAYIITMWFSRKREFRADLGSAAIVGKAKMISALRQIKRNFERKRLIDIKNPEMKVFFIHGKCSSNLIKRIFLSHPTIESRIKALEENDSI